MNVKAILVAGGHGSRLYPFTKISQKTLMPIYDRPVIDYALGTPPHTMLIASSHGHSQNSLLVPEEQYFVSPGIDGIQDARVRADIVYFTTPNGGAVFSVSSMAWCGSLPHNDYDNNVSQLTGNVLDRFASDEFLEEIV